MKHERLIITCTKGLECLVGIYQYIQYMLYIIYVTFHDFTKREQN